MPLLPSASDPVRQGLVRIINHAGRAGEVRLRLVDDAGNRAPPIVLPIEGGETLHVNSDDLENGNDDKGIAVGTGPGNGDWRLKVESDLDVEVLAYIRTADGFLTAMHDTVARSEDDSYRVAFFNPGGNANQVSSLRLINSGDDVAKVTITGTDDRGMTPGDGVDIEIPAGVARTLTSAELETGGAAFEGSLGDGIGKWQLSVHADRPVTVVSLLASPSGEISNLSAAPNVVDETGSHVVALFPAASDPTARQGFVRVINRSDESGSVSVDSNQDHDPVMLSIGAGETLHFNSDDWEFGNSAKGLPGVGGAVDDWRLSVSSDLDIEVLSYIRTPDGFVTPMYGNVPAVGHRHRVAIFNPAGNTAQVSQLRLANPGTHAANVWIDGVDDHGAAPGGTIELSLAGGQTRTLDAGELEAGSPDFGGRLGDGTGKWQLIVESDTRIGVMSLLESPTGHLSNLSGVPANTAPPNASAFNDRAVGKRIVQGEGTRYVDFLDEDRYRDTQAGETASGSYSYSNTGAATALLSLTADDGSSCSSDLVFESRVSGRLSGCDGGAEASWRLLEATRGDGDRVTHELTAMIGSLSESEVPEVVRGAVTTVSDGAVRIDFDNGGYVETGDHRYTCRDAAGCVVDDGVVTRGRIVRTPALGARDFDLLHANGAPGGLVHNDGHFYVVDETDLKVYAYDESGEPATALDFELADDNKMPAGVTVEADRFYVVDADDFLDRRAPRNVFVYDTTGEALPDAGFTVDSAIREPLGIAYFDDRLFLADNWTRKVYAFRSTGERDADADFDLDPDNLSPRGIAYGNDRFFVVDIFEDSVYAYRTNGDRDPAADFVLADGNGLARGIDYVDGRFFVVDPDRVFAYPSDRPDLVVDAFATDDFGPDAGTAFALDVTVRNVGHRRSAPTTVRYYRSRDTTIPRNDDEVGNGELNALEVGEASDQSASVTAPSRAGFYYYGACIDRLPDEYVQRNCSEVLEITVPVDIDGPTVGFALDALNRRPVSIAYGNSRFFVVDSQDDHVYAYRTSAARDPDSEFGLDADNDRPVAIAYAMGRFYVIDAGDDKVYAYDASGERDADADFALDADNGSASGLAFAAGRFYVADRTDDKIYAYGATGEREAPADFDLFRGNDTPWGMTFADDRLYVVDLIDDHVYAYSTSGERDTVVEFGLHPDNGSPAGIAAANDRLYVADSTDDTVYGYAITKVADLAIDEASVSSGSPDPGATFTFSATVRNLGDGRSHSAGIRYYLASDSAYETAGDLAGTDSVGPLDSGEAQAISFAMTAPTDDGCYFCGACVDGVRGERARSNNCAAPAEILLGDGPDMDFSRIQTYAGEVGDPVEVTIAVINRGTGTSLPGELRFTGGDDVVLDIPALAPNEEQIFERQQIGTGRSGRTTYEMCIDVPCEGNPEDDCRTRSITL
ncbi:MAG: hypothetical protein OXU77_02295 [Gammaproteobacteria bacterium]|nr:hypothetical protein [Gammaproteobacteria bacterium]